MDEPSANLDIAAMEKLSERMKVIKEKGHTVIVAEHRLAWIQKFADRIIYIKEGRIEQEFTSDEFKALSDLRREQMGLRSIIPEQIQIPEITVNSEDAVLQVCNLSGKRKKQMIFENISLSAGEGISLVLQEKMVQENLRFVIVCVACLNQRMVRFCIKEKDYQKKRGQNYLVWSCRK